MGSILQGTRGPPGGSPDVHSQCRVFMQSAGQSREKDLRAPGSSVQQWRERPSFAWMMTGGVGALYFCLIGRKAFANFLYFHLISLEKFYFKLRGKTCPF